MSWTREEIDETLRHVVERSMSDSGFRSLALKDAKAAISRVTSTPVAADFKIQFVDNAGADLTVVLPDPQATVQAGVSDEELAGVAGGTLGTFSTNCPIYTGGCATFNNLTACNPLYTKKPNSPTLCPH